LLCVGTRRAAIFFVVCLICPSRPPLVIGRITLLDVPSNSVEIRLGPSVRSVCAKLHNND
jgi:hypothetical protein